MTLVEVPLTGLATKGEVLKRLGEILELGGPGGNIPAGMLEGRGWGLNWDALADSLTELENGGIWGTSPRFEFPLALRITNSDHFKITDPEGFATLNAILGSVADHYAKHGRQFEYEFS